jgi:hypothetical protein
VLLRVVVLSCLVLCSCDVVFRIDPVGAPADAAAGTDIAFVQSAGLALSGANQASVTFFSPVHDGDLVVVAIATFHGALLGVTDSAGNTYVKAVPGLESDGNSYLDVWFVADARAADPFTVTATVDGTDEREVTMAIHEYSGVSKNPLDKHVIASGLDDAAATSGPVSTTVEGELYFSALMHDDTATTTATSGFVLRERPTESNVGAVPLVTADIVGGPAGDAISADFALTVSGSWLCALLTFR